MFNYFRLDSHSVAHFVGCYALVPTLMSIFGFGVWAAAGIALILGVIWELLDGFNRVHDWGISFLDPRGGDVVDIIVDAAGVLLAVLIFG